MSLSSQLRVCSDVVKCMTESRLGSVRALIIRNPCSVLWMRGVSYRALDLLSSLGHDDPLNCRDLQECLWV